VKLLEEIRAFPEPMRRKLETRYGIDSAEAFFASAINNPAGMALAIDADPAEVDRLIRLVEGYLPANYRERCLHPVRHPGGLYVDPRRLKSPQR
jgi:16S rRNA C967 or C1407 C5-methylase (RsmB/RsmF family)